MSFSMLRPQCQSLSLYVQTGPLLRQAADRATLLAAWHRTLLIVSGLQTELCSRRSWLSPHVGFVTPFPQSPRILQFGEEIPLAGI